MMIERGEAVDKGWQRMKGAEKGRVRAKNCWKESVSENVKS
jgi:hypothetical protein